MSLPSAYIINQKLLAIWRGALCFRTARDLPAARPYLATFPPPLCLTKQAKIVKIFLKKSIKIRHTEQLALRKQLGVMECSLGYLGEPGKIGENTDQVHF